MSKPAIVCVDDERIVLVSLRDQLQRHFGRDYYIEIAQSGDEAIEIFQELTEEENEVPLIISDHIMPGMKGDQLLRELHQQHPKTLSILLTGQADAKAVGNAVNYANLYRYIAKPWNEIDLSMSVTEALRRYFRDKKLAEQNDILRQMNDELEEVNQAYERFVPVEFTNFVGKKSIIEVELGDQVSKKMAVMFSDIRSFTTLSETMSPQENFNFINAYLKRVSPQIRNNNGFIVKYLGDGIMAIFPNGVDDAIRAGIAKLKQVAKYNIRRQQQGFQKISIGIGIHVGHMMVGMVGERARMQGDAFSDHVSLAEELEGLTKSYAVSFIISQDALNDLPQPHQYDIRFLDKIIIGGRKEAMGIYEVVTENK
jgi:class 3 adenylate cyclase/CheY-like chemotaxis protein